MKPETSKATGRPWKLEADPDKAGFILKADDGTCICEVYFCGPTYKWGGPASREEVEANKYALVQSVNVRDALEAERDALKAALQAETRERAQAVKLLRTECEHREVDAHAALAQIDRLKAERDRLREALGRLLKSAALACHAIDEEVSASGEQSHPVIAGHNRASERCRADIDAARAALEGRGA